MWSSVSLLGASTWSAVKSPVDVPKAQAQAVLLVADGAQEVVAGFVQHGVLHHGARGDNPDDVPLYQALGQFGVLQLLADGHLIALCHQLGDVAFGAVEGHAAHGGALLLAALPAGEGELQLPGDGLGVVEEHFVKIAKAKEKYRVRILFFHLKILFHHWGKIRHCLLNQPFPFPGERRPSPCVSQWQPPQLAQLPPQEDASQVAGSSPSAHRLRMPVICCSRASNSFLASL